jgi:hypothetical protein
MTPSRDDSHFDVRGIFWRVFWIVFLVRELIVWSWLQRMPLRHPGHRMLIFLLSGRCTPGSLVWALVGGGIAAIVLFVLDKLVVKPLIRLRLSPVVDSSSVEFHLRPGEKVRAKMACRRFEIDGSKAGTLLLTDRRLWFVGGDWHDEPWSIELDKIDGIDTLPTFIARVAPVRNWPERIRFRSRTHGEATFATASTAELLDWFDLPAQAGPAPYSSIDPRVGVFDA